MLDRLKSLLAWFRLYHSIIGIMEKLPEAIETTNARIEALEVATFHGNIVHKLHVPYGMSVQTAWLYACGGKNLEGEGIERYVLIDRNNNMLKAL